MLPSPTTAPNDGPPRALPKSFRALCIAQAASSVPHYALNLTLVLLVARTTDSSFWSGLLIVALLAPATVGGLVAGNVADRFPPGPVMAVSHAARGHLHPSADTPPCRPRRIYRSRGDLDGGPVRLELTGRSHPGHRVIRSVAPRERDPICHQHRLPGDRLWHPPRCLVPPPRRARSRYFRCASFCSASRPCLPSPSGPLVASNGREPLRPGAVVARRMGRVALAPRRVSRRRRT